MNLNSELTTILDRPLQVITAEFPGLCELCCGQREDIAWCIAENPSTFRACRQCRNEYDPFFEWVAKVRAEAGYAKDA